MMRFEIAGKLQIQRCRIKLFVPNPITTTFAGAVRAPRQILLRIQGMVPITPVEKQKSPRSEKRETEIGVDFERDDFFFPPPDAPGVEDESWKLCAFVFIRRCQRKLVVRYILSLL